MGLASLTRVIGALLACLSIGVHATVIYQYQGQLYGMATNSSVIAQNYDVLSMSVSGSFEVESRLPESTNLDGAEIASLITQYSFFDGNNTLQLNRSSSQDQ